MKYAILIYEPASDFAARAEPPSGPYWSGWMAYSQAMNEVTTGGAPLRPAETATTVRVKDGRRLVQDGPYADTREQLGGFYLIDVLDLDAALEWAARCPASATGAVEVRPVLPMQTG